MELFTTIPASMIMPSHTGMEGGNPVNHRPAATPTAAKGTQSRITTGLRNDSY